MSQKYHNKQTLEELQDMYYRGKRYLEEDLERERAKRFYFENMMREREQDGKCVVDLSHLLKNNT